MISKIAIQAGLGVTTVGGAAGISTYFLTTQNKEEYLVEITDLKDQPSTNILKTIDIDKKITRNYYCQWNNKKDNNCILKKIKFETSKLNLLSNLINQKNSEISQKTEINLEKKWFILTIKGYSENLKTNAPSIDIMPTATEENKKYVTVTPKIKIKNKAAVEGYAQTFLTKFNQLQAIDSIVDYSKTYKCKLKKNEFKFCNIYSLNSDPAIDLNNISKYAILSNKKKLNFNFGTNWNNYFIIHFATENNKDLPSVSNWSSLSNIVIQDNETNKYIGTFSITTPVIWNLEIDAETSKFIILN